MRTKGIHITFEELEQRKIIEIAREFNVYLKEREVKFIMKFANY